MSYFAPREHMKPILSYSPEQDASESYFYHFFLTVYALFLFSH